MFTKRTSHFISDTHFTHISYLMDHLRPTILNLVNISHFFYRKSVKIRKRLDKIQEKKCNFAYV